MSLNAEMDSFSFNDDDAIDSLSMQTTNSTCTINGTVTDFNNEPVPNITIMLLGNNDVLSTITDSNGFYQFSNADVKRVYTIMPCKYLKTQPMDNSKVSGETIVNNALKELGNTDGPVPGRYHGHGRGWCSEFVSWVYFKSGDPFVGGRNDGGYCNKDWNMSTVHNVIAGFGRNSHWQVLSIDEINASWQDSQNNPLEPQAGDYVFFSNTSGINRSHSGLVKNIQGTTMYTIEGNVGNRVESCTRSNWRTYQNGNTIVKGIGYRRIVSNRSFNPRFYYGRVNSNLSVNFKLFHISKNPLIQTQWGQINKYARFSPNNERLGCWSTAIAQILYFHRLRPSGNVAYKGTYYNINENFDSYKFNWDLFVNNFDNQTPIKSIDEVARYAYYTAAVIQKDFGTGTYVINSKKMVNAIKKHYDCKAQEFSTNKYKLSEIKKIIRDELTKHNPVMMFMKNLSKTRFHAVVIDGYRIKGDLFDVHINMGWEGNYDGWYDFDKAIFRYDDTSYKKIITIQPKINKTKFFVEPAMFDLKLTKGQKILNYLKIYNKNTLDLKWNLEVVYHPDSSNDMEYICKDSQNPEGPRFDWIDITQSATKINGLTDDNCVGPFAIGFPFEFYSNSYSKFYVSSNGFIGFELADSYRNKPIPYNSQPNNFLAWCWDDLIPKKGSVYYQTIDNKLIIQFKDYGQYRGKGSVNSEVIINSNGSILYQYKNFNQNFVIDKCTVGIENREGNKGVEAAYNTKYLYDSFAVLFYKKNSKLLAVEPLSGIIKSNNSKNVTLNFDTTDVEPGVYRISLIIKSNDKTCTPLVVPIKLHVLSNKVIFLSTTKYPASSIVASNSFFQINNTFEKSSNSAIHFENNSSNNNLNYKHYKYKFDQNLLVFSFIPTYGNRIKNLEGYLNNVNNDNHKILVYIYVDEWRLKSKTQQIKNDKQGKWVCDITTEPNDHLASKVAVFLIPKQCNIKLNQRYEELPQVFYKKSIDHITINRLNKLVPSNNSKIQ